ncbi:hypothetical protein L3Q82_018421 [Scortum barcoo]|uniref:Uncharacterized protein n=1 Tax=Scortum barcoo TaxID=214431 RepID=A0ACB8VJ32_9TELE|nr:hypothetical protein L3Q82_018421 [Scortum barcoo]
MTSLEFRPRCCYSDPTHAEVVLCCDGKRPKLSRAVEPSSGEISCDTAGREKIILTRMQMICKVQKIPKTLQQNCDAFVELYGEPRRPFSFWSLKTVFGLAVLGAAGITLGALFTWK